MRHEREALKIDCRPATLLGLKATPTYIVRMNPCKELCPPVKKSNPCVEVPGLKSLDKVERMEASATSAFAYEVKNLDGLELVQLFNRYKMGLLWNNKRDEIDAGQRKLLKSLWDNKQKGTLKCKTPIVYRLKGKVGELGYGRYYSTIGSMEQMERDIRATLCSELYWDIDIINAHPCFAVQLSKKEFGREMPMLEYYVNNRKACIEKFKGYGLSESDAKQVVISLINGGALKDKKTADGKDEYVYSEELRSDSLVVAIKAEVKELIDGLIAGGKHSALYNQLFKEKGNYRGSFIANLYQTIERKCLDVMVAVLKAKGYDVRVLSYDGCMILKDGVVMPNEDVMNEIEKAVKYYTEYDIKLKIKPMDDEVIPLGELEVATEDGYAEMKVEWERNHFYYRTTGTIVEEADSGRMIHYKIEHATEAFNMWKLKTKDGDGNPLSFLKKWRTDPDRRIIDEFVYKLPENCEPNEASIFKGFAYKRIDVDVSEEEKAEYIKVFKSMMLNIAPDGEEGEVYKALLKNFARIIQKPFIRPDLCIILRSKGHGVGKETLITTISAVIGKNTAHYTSDDAFWDKHDTQKEGALLVHLEEAGMSNKKMADALKARITSEVMNIRPCNVSGYEVPNVALYMMTTNKDCPVKLEESDRRYFIINIPERVWTSKEEKFAYWDSVYAVNRKPGFLKTIGEYLETIDLTGFRPRDFPETEYKQAIMENSKTPEVQFLENWVSTDQTHGDYIADMYNAYKSYCIEQNLPYRPTSGSFAIAIAGETRYYVKKNHPETRRAVYKNKSAE
jgi:hypothetical protein